MKMTIAQEDKRARACKLARDWRQKHPDKVREYHRVYRLKYPEKERLRVIKSKRKNYPTTGKNNHLLRSYGITIEQYNQTLINQGGVCAICKGLSTDGKSLHVDHNHKLGGIRGLLCSRCNKVLGSMRDDISLLKEVIKYLESNGAKETNTTDSERPEV